MLEINIDILMNLVWLPLQVMMGKKQNRETTLKFLSTVLLQMIVDPDHVEPLHE